MKATLEAALLAIDQPASLSDRLLFAFRTIVKARCSEPALWNDIPSPAARAPAHARRQLRSLPVATAALGTLYTSVLGAHLTADPKTGALGLATAAGSRRKRTGSYYTPPSLSGCLLDEALTPLLEDGSRTICDPSCGSGHFLAAAAERLVSAGEAPAHVVAAQLFGVDRDPVAVLLARLRLWELAPSRASARALRRHIRCGDALLGPVRRGGPGLPGGLRWHRAFPAVMKRGGFSLVIGNPPWEKLKTQARAFFASRAPEIAQAKTAAARRERIARLADEDPALHSQWEAARAQAAAVARHVSRSGAFPRSAAGDLNTYPLFLERALDLVAPHGYVGMIVKTGILSDYSMRGFFRSLLEQGQLVSAFDFSNRAGLFPDVVANERFTLMTLRGGQHDAPPPFSVSVLNTRVETVREPARLWTLAPADVARINPHTRTCSLWQRRADAELVRDIYRRQPVLLGTGSGAGGPWGACYRRVFDMTNDSGLFRTQEQLLDAEGGPPRAVWGSHVPVLEGKLFDLFDHRHGDFAGVNAARRFRVKAEPGHHGDAAKARAGYAPLPRYWAPAAEARARLVALAGHSPAGILCFRDVCRTHTDLRTVRATICPPHAAGNKAPVLVFPGLSPSAHARRSAMLLAVMGSLVFDYVARQKFAGGSLNRYILAQLPVPTPEQLAALPWLVEDVVALSCTDEALRPFAALCGFDRAHRWEPADRFARRCRLDAAMMHLYGLDRAQAAHVLGAFPILRRAETTRLGSFRTREAVLAEFEAMTPLRSERQSRSGRNIV